MRLVTYDRGGARRLGAWVGDSVVDLPDAVGHPAFPTTMEALVAHSGGTILDAAREALSDPDIIEEFAVSGARLRVPILPSAVNGLSAGHTPKILGPDRGVPWPASAAALDYELELACILGRWGRDLWPEQVGSVVFGYTLAVGWLAPDRRRVANGRHWRYVGLSLGPCVTTADDFDPGRAVLRALVDGELWSQGDLATTRWTVPELVAGMSRGRELYPGDLVGTGTFLGGSGRDVGRALSPGSVVEFEADGIGILRARVGVRAQAPGRKRSASPSVSRGRGCDRR